MGDGKAGKPYDKTKARKNDKGQISYLQDSKDVSKQMRDDDRYTSATQRQGSQWQMRDGSTSSERSTWRRMSKGETMEVDTDDSQKADTEQDNALARLTAQWTISSSKKPSENPDTSAKRSK